MVPTPAFPEVTFVGPQSAQLRRPRPRSATAGLRPLQPAAVRKYRSFRDGAGERSQIDRPKAQLRSSLLPTLVCSVALAASITRAGIW
jgi:hypothetical protein